MTVVVELAAKLHAARCQSAWWSEDCRRSDGGRHARETWRPAVRAALRSPDPAAQVHDMICDVHLDPCHTCPDRERHIELIAEALSIPREATP